MGNSQILPVVKNMGLDERSRGMESCVVTRFRGLLQASPGLRRLVVEGVFTDGWTKLSLALCPC
jgi:hypothetical protein